tara:strand:- start:2842 stop:2988 length:147 start_codon:yes stop_codon:yes gene_type:complete
VAFLDTALVILIMLFIFLIVWSRIMGQKMLDTLIEIKTFAESFRSVEE